MKVRSSHERMLAQFVVACIRYAITCILFTMDTVTITVRLEPQLLKRADVRASAERRSRNQVLVMAIERGFDGAEDDDVRGAGGGQAVAAIRGGDDAGVSVVPVVREKRIARQEKRLHSMQRVRNELVGRGGHQPASTAQPCAIAGHHSYRQGTGWFCADCTAK